MLVTPDTRTQQKGNDKMPCTVFFAVFLRYLRDFRLTRRRVASNHQYLDIFGWGCNLQSPCGAYLQTPTSRKQHVCVCVCARARTHTWVVYKVPAACGAPSVTFGRRRCRWPVWNPSMDLFLSSSFEAKFRTTTASDGALHGDVLLTSGRRKHKRYIACLR